MVNGGDLSSIITNVNAQRPYIAEDGKSYITVQHNVNGEMVDEAVAVSNAATLRYDEWKQIDDAILEVYQEATPFIEYARRNGLTYSLDNALGTPELGYEVVSDMNGAFITMDGSVRGNDDTVQFDIRYMPIPIIAKNWTLNLRRLAASRKRGEALDVTQLRITAKKIEQFVEDLCVKGEFTNNGLKLQGLTKFDHRVTGGTGKNRWDASTKTGAQIFADVQAMIHSLKDKGFKSGYTYDLFIPENYEDKLEQDYSSQYQGSIKTRLKEISALGEIVTLPSLPDHEVVMLVRSKDVFELVLGMPLTVLESETLDGYVKHYTVQEITLPRIKCDYNNNCGIVDWAITNA